MVRFALAPYNQTIREVPAVPELPEVETVVRDLRPLLVGRRLTALTRATGEELRRPWDPAWEAQLLGQVVSAIDRRGKWIDISLQGERTLLVHLGMTGQLTVVAATEPLLDHTHVIFDLDNGQQLRFRDVRRFGSMTFHPTHAARDGVFTEAGLGPEPFDLQPAAWRQSLQATARPIKAVLLDQGVVAGVGNIYADEALFRARLHPGRIANQLTRAEAERLRKSIASVLREAIEHRGSSIRDYIGGSGLRGGYQEEFRAYGRTGEPCPRCGTPIASLRLAGRSSHYCPTCQPEADSRAPASPE
jgi:formamidopyrimidine-DNA glycosylase